MGCCCYFFLDPTLPSFVAFVVTAVISAVAVIGFVVTALLFAIVLTNAISLRITMIISYIFLSIMQIHSIGL